MVSELISSNVLEYENSRNPNSDRARAVEVYLRLASKKQMADQSIRQRARDLEKNGVKAIDALHVACAEAAKSDYLLTCDKRLINRCKNLSLQVISPVNYILESSNESEPSQ